MYLYDFVYLFFVEVDQIYFGKKFEAYQELEPGYVQSWIQAYLNAFKTSPDEPLKTDFIKKIHSTVMSFDKDNKVKYAGYRTQETSFQIQAFEQSKKTNDQTQIVDFTATTKGIDEFINKWIITNDSVHQIIIEKKADKNTYFQLQGTSLSEYVKNKLVTSSKFNVEIDGGMLNKLISDNSYKVFIKSTSHLPSKKDGPSKNHVLMESFVAQYNASISKAKSADEKIAVIVTLAQKIAQLRPFNGAVIRTCYILINTLLRNNKLSISLLINPNRLDCCSLDELVQMVKEGQNNYNTFMMDKEELILRTPTEIHSYLKIINCPQDPLTGVPENLVTDFVKYILKNSSDKANTANRNEHEFFSKTSTSKADAQLLADLNKLGLKTIDETIMNPLHQADYNAALRNACYVAPDSRIITTILQHKDRLKINVNETSKNSGRNAITWLKLNSILAPSEKEAIEDQLLTAAEQAKQNEGGCSLM